MLALVSSTARAANLSPELDVGDRIAWVALAAERSVTFDGCEMVVLAKQGRFLGADDLGDAVDRVYASRVALDGTVKDPMGVPLELDSALGASNGGEIVTIENAPGLFGTPANSSPSFARLGGDLKILGRRVLDEPWGSEPSLACENGGCLLIQWNETQSFSARLVDFRGASRADGVVSVTNNGWLSGPLIATSTNGYVVAYTDQVNDGAQGVFTAEVSDAARAPIAPRQVLEVPGSPLQLLALARSDSGFLIVAEVQPEAVQTMPSLIAVRTSGSSPIELGTDGHDYEVDAFGVGDHFVVGFRQKALGTLPPGPATIAQISASGVSDLRAATRAFGPSVSTPRGRFVLDDSMDLHQILDDGTEGGTPIHSMSTLYPEWRPLLVPGTRNLLLTYQDRDATTYRWHAIRLGPDGAPLDETAAPVFTQPVDATSNASASPAKIEAAFDGAAFELGWLDDAGNLELVRENPDSGVRDTPVSLCKVDTDFRLHAGPQGVLVTWSETRMCGEDCAETRLLGMPVDGSGHAMLAAPAVLLDWTNPGVGEVGRADFDGVRWSVPRVDFGGLHVSTITATGLVTAADPWGESTTSLVGGASLVHPRMAWSGAEHLVVFEEDATDPSTSAVASDVRAIRLDGNLTPLDAAPIVVAPPGNSTTPEVVFDGARFVVAWRQAWPGQPDSDLAATFVALDGTTQSSDCFLASNALWSELDTTLAPLPSLTPSTSGRVLIGYTRLDPDPALVSSRVKLRVISSPDGTLAPRCMAPDSATQLDAPFVPAGCADAPVNDATKITGGCGCSVVTNRSVAGSSASAALFAAILTVRRGRRRRRSRTASAPP